MVTGMMTSGAGRGSQIVVGKTGAVTPSMQARASGSQGLGEKLLQGRNVCLGVFADPDLIQIRVLCPIFLETIAVTAF